MITVKHIDTIDGIKDLIFEQTYNADIDRTRSSYCYRGMRNIAYKLTTSLQRNCKSAYAATEACKRCGQSAAEQDLYYQIFEMSG